MSLNLRNLEAAARLAGQKTPEAGPTIAQVIEQVDAEKDRPRERPAARMQKRSRRTRRTAHRTQATAKFKPIRAPASPHATVEPRRPCLYALRL